MAKKGDLKPRRLPSQQRSVETIELILDTTAALLEEGGAQSVTTNKIAEAAGMSVGSVYHFFKNKQSIFAALFDRQLKTFDTLVTGHFTEDYDHLSLEDFIGQVIDAIGDAYLETQALPVLLLTMQTDPELNNISLGNRSLFAEWVAGLLTRRLSDAPAGQVKAASVVIVETVNGVYRRWMALQHEPKAAKALQTELKMNIILYLRGRFGA